MKTIRYISLYAAMALVSVISQVAGMGVAVAAEDIVVINHAAVWNRFAKDVYALHEKQLTQHEVKQVERIGGYARNPGFYREVTYIDNKSGRVLSRIQWERKKPENIHVIEVNVYDEAGRLIREYIASFLVDHRNAPAHTMINLHGYGEGAHGYRQFDASGDRLYEHCVVTKKGKTTEIELDDYEFPFANEPPLEVMKTPEYQACFANVQDKLGRYIKPE